MGRRADLEIRTIQNDGCEGSLHLKCHCLAGIMDSKRSSINIFQNVQLQNNFVTLKGEINRHIEESIRECFRRIENQGKKGKR